jgi:hypothetical protein
MRSTLIIFTIALSISSCRPTYFVLSPTYDYTESISFVIDKVQEGRQISTGNGYYVASRGNKFVHVFVTFTNKLDKRQDLDFENVYLLNPKNKAKHKVEFAMLTGPINLWGKIDSSINKEDVKKRDLVFIFPKEEKAKYLIVNGKVIEINYKG